MVCLIQLILFILFDLILYDLFYFLKQVKINDLILFDFI